MSRDTFISRLAQHIQNRYDLKKEDITVVFPNKRAASYLRNELKNNNSQTFWLPQMISIEEAVTQWSGIAKADAIDLLFELIDIDAELHVEQASDLSVFGSQAAQMAKDFDEIDQYGIDAKSLFNYVLENKKIGLWDFDTLKSKEKEQKYLQFFHSLHDYYLRLRDRLAAKGKGYYGMITRYLAELPETSLLEKAGEGKVIFAGFNALTATEERIINTMVKNGKAEILFDYDSYYIDDPNNEAGLFARRHQAKHPDWLRDGITDRLRTEPKTIHIISASGNTLQTKALQAKLEETKDPNQTIVLADEHLLIPVLNGIPETYPCFHVSMGYPITKTPVNQFVKEYFSLCRRNKITRKVTDNGTERVAEGWYIWPVLHLMDLELVKIAFPKAENDAFSQWKTEAVKSGKFIFEEKDLESISQIPHIQQFLSIILKQTEGRTPQSVLTALAEVLTFVTHTLSDQYKEAKPLFLLNQLGETDKLVSRLLKIVQGNTKYVKDLQSTEILYRLLASSATIKLKSDGTEGLQIMGLLETRNLSFDRLHVLSVNEGIMPPDKPQGSFIPQFIRHAYGLPGYSESQAVVAYHFYRLLQSGNDIFLYFNNLGETSGGEASRFILQIKHELVQNPNITVIEESFGCEARASLENKPLKVQKTNALDRLHYLIGQKGLSPSALSTYLNCTLKYYLRYVAQIEDNSVEEDVGVNDIGTVIHDTLELLFADYLPRDGKQQIIDKPLFDNEIQPKWREKLKEAIANKFPNGFPDVGYNYLNRVTIEQQLKNYLDYTSKQLENSVLTILETEGELRTTLPSPLGDCIFYGRTDRIDRFNGLVRVIDYKTGHVDSGNLKVPVRHRSESDLEFLRLIPDKALQLLLYKYLYLKENASLVPDQVTGAIHGLKYAHDIDFNLYQAAAKKDDEDADANFLSDSTFIADMEAMLEAVVAEMLDTEIPFEQAEDDKKCGYCEFKLICKR